ncbi:MAG: ABC transporter ATP-binding protein/permease [Treponema sp.]|jgi:ABC-type multidrug transport system fused ATPase/permease subunit|nr:ABC transporter ATP-binding protein/permease [Treponema sp.]
MKWFDETKTRLICIGRMIRILWMFDRSFLFVILTEIIVLAVLPFINMYLIKYSIDMLTNAADFRSYLPTVLILLGTQLIGSVVQAKLGVQKDIHGNMSGNTLFAALFKKTMELDYEMLLDKTLMEKRQMAMKVFDGGRFNNLTSDFRSFVYNLMIVCGIIYIVVAIEFWILLIVVVIVFINSVVTSIRTRAERDIWQKFAPVNRKIEYFLSIDSDTAFGKEIRLYKMHSVLFMVFGELQKLTQKLLGKSFGLFGRSRYVYHITSFCLNALIYGYLGFKILVQRLITVGDFSLYLNAITTFNNSIQEMIGSYIAISDNGRYLKDYFDYMELKSRYEKTGRSLPSTEHEIVFVFENVSFCYPHQTEPVLKNINLIITNKERLSIVGENGAGKTTLIKLLMRFFEPATGRITLNGVDIRDIEYEQYLSLFSSVFQDFRLFAFRIADNITSLQGEDEAPVDQAKLRDCLVKAGLDKKIDSLEKGLDTYLYKLYEEDGIELSGGESQKLAIARALYKDAPVVVLDEPTAALDPRAEYEIYTRFFEMVHNKTSVFITHRLSSTRFCDRIVVLKNGEIVETGSHDELLARNGYYAELFNMQAQFYTDKENGAGEPAALSGEHSAEQG